MDWIKPLSNITLADTTQVGPKAAHLGALARAGFSVPNGFVITVDAFIDHFGTQTDPLVRPPVPRLQSELMNEVVQALMDQLGDADQLAVRSSATEEDGSQASFAGQHSTYYFVSPQRLDEAIIDCWMSLWSDAALAYRRAGWDNVSSGTPVRMAVIVQKMLKAESAGVAFSADPINPERKSTVIEACWGLGAAMVDGRVTPDHYRVDDQDTITTRRIVDKKYQVQISAANSEGKRLQELSRERRLAPVLNDDQVHQLANIAQQLETLFEYPQDVEWAYEDQQLYLLQSRPISTFPGYHDISRRLVLFKPLLENFTEPLTPMSADLYAALVPDIGGIYQGRVYLSYDLIDLLNPFDISEADLTNITLLRDPQAEIQLNPTKSIRGIGLLSLGFLIDGMNWLRTSWLQPADLQAYAKRVTRILANPAYDAKSTLKRLIWGQHPLEPITAQMLYCNVSAGRYFLMIGLLKHLIKRWLPNYDLNELNDLFHLDEDTAPVQLIRRMQHLAKELEETLTSDLVSDQEHIQQISAVLRDETHLLPAQAHFTESYEAFLHEFGHRGPREMELAAPRWKETPGPLLRLIQGSGSHPEDDRMDPHATRLQARDRLNQQLTPLQRRIAGALISRIRRYITLRENTRQYHVMAFSAARQKLLEMEQRLIANLRLQIPGDIFYLRFDEAQALEHGQLSVEDAQLLIRRRRRRWNHLNNITAPETINLSLPGVPTDTPERQPGQLNGHCASPGNVRGLVRVITTLDEGHLLESGEILVAPYTDPAWTPLFTRAAGVVVETGSYLSHAGTVAREFHTPCLVDVPGCIDHLKTGQTITLDATNGFVLTLEETPADVDQTGAAT